MNAFQEFIKAFGPQHFAIGGAANFIINSLVMWFVVNQLLSQAGKVPLWRCAVCSLLLYLVSSVAVALALFPVPIVLVLAALFWLVGSIIVIRSVFQLTYDGGGLIMFLYLIVLVAVHGLLRKFI